MALLSITNVAVVGALVALIFKLLIEPLFLSPLSKIPSAHPSAHISPLWIYYIRYANIENETIFRLHEKKGPIIRLAPNELSINCYEQGLKTVYTGGFDKTEFYGRRFCNYGGVTNLFSMIDSKSHSQRKRMLSNVYSKSFVLSSPTTPETTKAILFGRFLPLLQKSAEDEKPVETLSLSYAYSMDSFMAYQYGLSLSSNFIEDIKQREWYLKNFFGPRPHLFWPTEVPSFTSFLGRLGIQLLPDHVDRSVKDLENWTLEACDKAEQLLSDDVKLSAIDTPVVFAQQRAAMQKQDRDSKGQVDRNLLSIEQPYPRRLEIASDMHCHSAAAIETSGDTLTYLYYELSRRPELQEKLRNELLSISPHLTFPIPEGEELNLPNFKEIDSLPLLDAILQETLRRWPAVPGGQPRVTPYPSCKLAGYDNIPPGVRVQASAYALHKNPEIFLEPDEWKPERWMDATPAQLIEMRHWFWAWGSGGRMCIGSNFAVHSMKYAIASIYTNFTTSIVDADGIELAEGYTAGPKGNKLLLQYKRVQHN